LQVEAFLELSARISPEKTALICGDQRLSYQEIEEQCNRLAHALSDVGVQRGDHVAVYLENSVEAVVSIFAILKACTVCMLVNPPPKAKSFRMSWITHAPNVSLPMAKNASLSSHVWVDATCGDSCLGAEGRGRGRQWP
jgi:acyl-CoA synthetase (AMP-forming)/AMP-acid ligase II